MEKERKMGGDNGKVPYLHSLYKQDYFFSLYLSEPQLNFLQSIQL